MSVGRKPRRAAGSMRPTSERAKPRSERQSGDQHAAGASGSIGSRPLGTVPLGKIWSLSPDRDYTKEEVRCGLDRLSQLLAGLPAVHSVASDPSPDRWQVWFHIDPTHALAWDLLRHLTFAVNGYDCGNELARFQPVWDIDQPLAGGPLASMVWTIYPEVRRLDAELYAEYLRERLPGPTADSSEWRK
jgi:hypothetical protein